MTEAAAAPPPWFFAVTVTAIDAPGPAVAGTASAETTRSGPMVISRDVALLASCVSVSTPSASALAMT